MAEITVVRYCVFCDKDSKVEGVDADKYNAWLAGRQNGMPAATHSIQVLMPDLTADEREILISGTHPECWEKAFGGSDDDD